LGPIGAAVARQLEDRKGFHIVGAIDVDPLKLGQDAGEVLQIGRRLRLPVSDDLNRTIKKRHPHVAVLCTSSSLRKVVPQFLQILKHRLPIVTTTEEAAYTATRNRSLARQVDAAARKAKVAVLGTGVNPGFVMDALPIALTAVCERVDAITVHRIQDARIRRLPFQQKIGAGLTADEFQQRVDAGTVRHVGLAESITMIADAMGWRLDRVTDEIRPRLAQGRVSSQFLTVEPGLVCGLVQDGVGYVKGQPLVTLHMEAYLGAPESFDAVRISGNPPLSMRIAGGVHGDVATASITVNSIPKVLDAPPGLRTMRDMRLPSFFGG
jgi:4-hydroxy-tetrahydrodipicolinate reductase